MAPWDIKATAIMEKEVLGLDRGRLLLVVLVKALNLHSNFGLLPHVLNQRCGKVQNVGS
jgi:hypothetical protein